MLSSAAWAAEATIRPASAAATNADFLPKDMTFSSDVLPGSCRCEIDKATIAIWKGNGIQADVNIATIA
jgi:hypothetical protein